MRDGDRDPGPGEEAASRDPVSFWGKLVMAVAPFILLALLVAGFMLID